MSEVTCPYCGNPITSAKHKEILNKMKKEAAEHYNKAKQALEAKHKEELETARKQAKRALKKELDKMNKLLKNEQDKLKEQQREEKAKIEAAKKSARLQANKEIEDIKKTLTKAEKKNKANDLILKKKEREIKTLAADYEKKVKTAIKEERDSFRSEIKQLKEENKKAYTKGLDAGSEKSERKNRKLEKEIILLQRTVDNLQSEERGSIKENEVLGLLKEVFPLDTFHKVPRGESGADLIQDVHNRKGDFLGKIVYEIKDTKNWRREFITKAKDYKKIYKTPHVILVTNAFPKNLNRFAVVEGIILVHKPLLHWITKILRKAIEDVWASEMTQKGKKVKMAKLYNYMNSPEFRERMKGIDNHVEGLQKILQKEKTEHRSKWTRQETHLSEIIGLSVEITETIKDIIETPGDDARVFELPA